MCWRWTVACVAPKMWFNLLLVFYFDRYQSKIFPFLKGRQRCGRCTHVMVVLASSNIHNHHCFPWQKKSEVLGLQSSRKAVSKYKAVFPAKNTGKANRDNCFPASVFREGDWNMQWGRVAEMLLFLGVNDQEPFHHWGLPSCRKRSSPNAYSSSLAYALDSMPWIIPWKFPVLASTVKVG